MRVGKLGAALAGALKHGEVRRLIVEALVTLIVVASRSYAVRDDHEAE